VTAFVTGAQSLSSSTSDSGASSSSNNIGDIGAIVGGAVGGAALLAIVAAAIYICLRNWPPKRSQQQGQDWAPGPGGGPGPYMQQNSQGLFYVGGPSAGQDRAAAPAAPVPPVSPVMAAAKPAWDRNSAFVTPVSPHEADGFARLAGQEVETNERQLRSPRIELDPSRQGYWRRHLGAELE
jgi:hypothetical protein